MKTPIAESYPLKEIETGLWLPWDAPEKDFIYSDGERFERAITQILDSATDLSSSSEELEAAGIDWPTTYHLSKKRSHIIAGLNLGEDRRILEIGSGCGAITRYLSDQGHTIDGIEGSLSRAAIARKRCRDKSNVNIIVANYNDLKIPKETYHTALFIGVLEYAQRFGAQNIQPEQAVRQMVESTIDVLKPDGCLVVAIENRLGFKYIYGAGEDHYGVPYVGVAGYPTIPGELYERKKGIVTYSQDEWVQILSGIEGLHFEFYYPFPDYKMPDVVMSDSFVTNNKCAGNLTRKTPSYDPTSNWQAPVDEYSYWRHAAQIGSLGKVANSFGIVISKQPESIAEMLQFDFVCFPNQKRKNELQTKVEKKKLSQYVNRVRGSTQQTSNSFFRLDPQPDIYNSGKVLLDYWADILQARPDLSTLTHLVQELYKKKVRWLKQNRDERNNLDLTLLNILVDVDGHWHVFDREWFSTAPVAVETLMFRSLMYFACIYSQRLRFLAEIGWYTVFDFVDGCFAMLKLDFPSCYIDLVSLENKFQKYALKPQYYISAETRLAQRLNLIQDDHPNLDKFHPRLYFADNTGVFSNSRSIILENFLGSKQHHLVFPVFEASLQPGTLLKLRFDPADENSIQQKRTLKIYSMAVSIRQGGERKHLWASNNASEIAGKLKTCNMSKRKRQGMISYLVKHPDPQMLFEHRLPSDIANVGTIVFEVSLSFG